MATAKKLAEVFVEHIVTKFGPPCYLLSDNAKNLLPESYKNFAMHCTREKCSQPHTIQQQMDKSNDPSGSSEALSQNLLKL